MFATTNDHSKKSPALSAPCFELPFQFFVRFSKKNHHHHKLSCSLECTHSNTCNVSVLNYLLVSTRTNSPAPLVCAMYIGVMFLDGMVFFSGANRSSCQQQNKEDNTQKRRKTTVKHNKERYNQTLETEVAISHAKQMNRQTIMTHALNSFTFRVPDQLN